MGLGMDSLELESCIDRIEQYGGDTAVGHVDWKSAWSLIGQTGKAFKETRYDIREEKNAAWARYQLAIETVKSRQELYFKEKAGRHDFFKSSEGHMYQVMALADHAKPSSGLGEFVLFLVTGGLYGIGKMILEDLLGKVDEERSELMRRSEYLKEAGAYLSDHKALMVGKHKQQAFEHMQPIRERLQADRQNWKQQKDEIYDEKRRQYEERQAEKEAKRIAWEDRQQEWRSKQGAFVASQDAWIERLEAKLEHQRAHLSELEQKRDDAWNDSFIERVSGWIDECENTISSIENDIAAASAKRDAAQDRLNS